MLKAEEKRADTDLMISSQSWQVRKENTETAKTTQKSQTGNNKSEIIILLHFLGLMGCQNHEPGEAGPQTPRNDR